MPISHAGVGLAQAIASFAQQVPGLYDIHLKDIEEKKKKAAREGALGLLSEFESTWPKETTAAPVTAAGEIAGGTTTTQPSTMAIPAAPATAAATGVTTPAQEAELRWKEKAKGVTGISPEKVTVDISKEKWKGAMAQVESGGKYGAVGPQVDTGQARGERALGRYQIVPKFHFPKIGLDSNKQADINKFLNTPELQDELYNKITDEMWKKAGGDPQKATALYYGSGSAKPVPTAEGGKTMPTGQQHWGKVKEAMGLPADTRESFQTKVSTLSQPKDIVNDALQSILKDRPNLPAATKSKNRTKLDYFYEKATPEQIEAIEPLLKKLEGLATSDKEKIEQDMKNYNEGMDRWSRAVITAAALGSKIETQGLKYEAGSISKQMAALNARRQIIKSKMDEFSKIATTYAKLKGERQREQFREANKSFFKELPKGVAANFFDALPLIKVDPKYVVDDVVNQQLGGALSDIDAQLARISGGQIPEPLPPGATGQEEVFNLQNNLNKWITK